MNMQDVQKWMGDNKTDAALRDHNAEIEGGGLPSGRMSIKTGMGMILTRDPKAAFQSYADTRDKLAAGFHNNPSNQQKTSSRQSLQKQLELCVDFSQNIETWCKYNQQAMHNLETAIKETQQANVLQDTDASMYNSLES